MNLRPEQAFLVDCTRKALTRDAGPPLRNAVQGDIDWDHFLQESARHRVLPLVHRVLGREGLSHLPEPVRSSLERSARSIELSGFLATARALELLTRLQEQGVPAVLVKGPVVSRLAYGDIALRPFGDLDILIRKEHAVRARQGLVENRLVPDVDLPEHQLASYLRDENFFSFASPDGTLRLDLHWELSGLYGSVPLVLEDLEGRLQEMELLARRIWVLSPEDTVLYHCIHAASHCWETLEAVACLAGLLLHTTVDGDVLLRRAERLRCRRMLGLGLHLAEALFRVRIPTGLDRVVHRDPAVGALSREVQERLFREPGIPAQSGWSWRFSGMHLKVRDSAGDAIRYGLRLMFRPSVKEHMYYRLPARLAFLRSFLRPVRLGRESIQFLCNLYRNPHPPPAH